MRPFLLLSNDDGVHARGLRFLIETLRPYADLLVVAPDGPRSGFGCSITSSRPLSIKLLEEDEGLRVYSCSGTPVDCVKMAINLFPERRPDLVIGGINHGDNSSVNTHYSGTMGVATEGAMQGFPAVAFSLCDFSPAADFEPLRPYLIDLMFKAIAVGMPRFTCLNVNFPVAKKFRGIKVCRMGLSHWQKEVAERAHPWGPKYYWLVGERVNLEPEANDTDIYALEQGYITVTPTRLDVTDYGLVDVLKDIL